jgi:hypothetical protein
MKKYLSFIFIFIMIGCRSYRIDFNNDSYLNKKTISMEMYHKSYDWREGQVWSGKYVREIIKSESRPIVYYIELKCYNVAAEIAREAFIQIAGEKYNLQIVSRKDIIEHMITGEMWNSGSDRMITISVEIERDIENKIMNADSIEYRFYVDKNPVTLTVNRQQLDKIKQFINSK